MSQFTRTLALLAAILLMASGALFAGQPQISTPEGQLFSSLNRERISQGLPVLQWDDALASAARQHAVRMAQLDQMSHQLPGEPNLLARASEAGLDPEPSDGASVVRDPSGNVVRLVAG